jgi:hypothetical protein
MPQTVKVENLPGLVQDANKPAPDYITDLSGRRWPLASIDAAYAMADVTCESLALTNRYMAIVRDPAYAYADDYMRNKVRVAFTQIQCIQSRNLVLLTMLFRYYSLRTGFQTNMMKANNWRLDRIVAPDANGVATNFACNDYEDWLAVAKNLAADVLNTTRTNASILLGLGSSGTMQGMGVAPAVAAPVLLATVEAGTAAAATTGAVVAAESAGAAVIAVGGTAASGLLAAVSWPIVGIAACIVLGSVTAYGLKLGAAAWQEHDAADIALKKQDADAYLAAVKQRAEAKTDAERKAADELIAILDARRDKNAEQSGGLANMMFGGGFDFQSIAYTALGMVGIYMGLQLFLNRPKSSPAA